MLHLLGGYNTNDNRGDFFFANMFEGCRKGVSQKTLCKILKGSGSGRMKIKSEEITLFSNPLDFLEGADFLDICSRKGVQF